MAKKSPPAVKSKTRTERVTVVQRSTDREPAANRSAQPFREIVEQIVFAFVLAFLFRTFEAEAFVIPTGSMAPTLMGRHKDLECPKCKYRYPVSASSESEDEPARQPGPEGRWNAQVVTATCPLCRYATEVDPQKTGGKGNPAFNGDRIIVAKFPYDISEPRRWDVIVFHYPGDAKMNYIKRLVGLPKETVKISHGDIFTQQEGKEGYRIQRKPPGKLEAMLQIVYDNDYVLDELTKAGWPLRWQPSPGGRASAWKSTDKGRSYEIAAGEKPEWIRYQHVVPSTSVWQQIEEGYDFRSQPPRPQLITDFYSYNTGVQRYERSSQPQTGGLHPQSLGMHWVGDLMVEAQVDVKSDQGKILLDLVEGGRHFKCAIDIATGVAELSAQDLPDFHPKAETRVRGQGSHKIAFANVDDQLSLWVDGDVVKFSAPTTYPSRTAYPEAADLAPAGIAAQGAALTVSHIRLLRDIYYIADHTRTQPYFSIITDYPNNSELPRMPLAELVRFLSSPERWDTLRPGGADEQREVRFPLAADQFFVLGDNSPFSKDSRLWESEQYVDRDLLIGKALCIYWPHAWPAKHYVAVRLFGSEVRLPFWPNFRRMGFVR